MKLAIERLGHPQFDAAQIGLELVPAGAGEPARMRLQARELRIQALGQRLRDVRFECQPQPVQQPSPDVDGDDSVQFGPWRCEGPLRWQGGQAWQLAWQADAALSAAEVVLRHDGGELRMRLPLAQLPLSVDVRRAPVKWLAVLLPEVDWQAGRIDAELEQGEAASHWHGRLQARELEAQAAEGSVAVAGIELSGPFQVRSDADGRLRIQTEPVLSAGELLAGAVYMEWPQGSRVEFDLHADGLAGRWRLSRLQLRDGDFELTAQAELSTADEPWLRRLNAEIRMDLARHYSRYLGGVMAGLGQAGLKLTGGLHGRIELGEAGRLDRVDAELGDIDLDDPNGRYSLAGLTGQLAFRRDRNDSAAVDLAWRSLQLHALEFQPGRLRAQSDAGEIRMSEDLRLGLFGGEVIASDLVFRPLAERRDRIEASVLVRDIDIAQLSRAFDWPEFSGRLNGSLPELRYVDTVLTAGGEIDIRAFDGQVRILGLGIERPFGVAPALSADFRLSQLDLEPMTMVFGLGKIEGRLDGRIDGLRLIDWRPVAFDAELRTAERGRRRISQLAVNQLTELGGGGGIGGVQGRLMGVFDSFGYRSIGLSCRLHNEVCEMSGLDDSAGGYTILQGSGLPQITIRGFQRRVDWPVLVERLRAMAAGQAPEVR